MGKNLSVLSFLKPTKMKQLIYIKCVLHLSCVVYGLIYARFMGCTVNGFLSVYSSTHNIYDKGEKGNIKQCLKRKRIEILNLCFTTQADTRQKAEPSGYGCDPFNQNSDRSDREKWSTSKRWISFFETGGSEPIHWMLDRNFRKFWLNGSRPDSLRHCIMI